MDQNVVFSNSSISIKHHVDEPSYFMEDTQNTRYSKMSNKLFKYSFQKLCLILGLILFAILIILIFTINNHTSTSNITNITSKDTNNVLPTFNEPEYQMKVFLVDANQIRVYDWKTKNNSILHESTEDIIAFDVTNSSIFFIEKDSSIIQSILSTHGNMTFTRNLQPQGIAFESLTKKFYIIDKFLKTVSIIDIEKKYSGIILSNFDKLHDIVLDIKEGFMFILQYGKSILRANLDGSDLTKITSNRTVTSIALDRERKRIFWSDDNGISSTNYNGKKWQIFYRQKNVQSLTFSGNHLFWLSSDYNSNQYISACNITSGICENSLKGQVHIYNSKFLKSFSDFDIIVDKFDNPCEFNNGNCSDICLLASNGSRSCACRIGYTLNSNNQSCQRATNFILYTENNFIKGMYVDVNQSSTFNNDAIIPIHHSENIIDFDYDIENDNLYFSDRYNIYMTKIFNVNNDYKVRYETLMMSNSQINHIYFDPLSKNLYYASLSAGKKPKLDMNFVQKRGEIIVKRNSSVSLGTCDYYPSCNETYIFIPKENSFIYKSYFGYYARVHKINTNELKPTDIEFSSRSKYFKLLTLDYNENKIYFLNNDVNREIFYSDTKFSDIRKFILNLHINGKIKSMAVDDKYIYINDLSGIWRVDKKTGLNTVLLTTRLSDNIKVYNLPLH